MGSLTQPSPATEERDSNWLPILLGVALVIVVVGIAALLLRTESRIAVAPHPYAANLKLSDLKMSAAENFVGATVTYLDGTVTNTGDKTVSHAVTHVSFKDSIGQIAQAEDVPLHVLQTPGPYAEAVDLSVMQANTRLVWRSPTTVHHGGQLTCATNSNGYLAGHSLP